MGLAHLVETRLGKPTRLTRDGLISRAENRAMVELLDLELVPDRRRRPGATDEAVVMVDSQPNTGRHSFDPELPALRRHRPPRHARRPGRRPVRGRPRRPRGDLLAGHQLPDRAGRADPARALATAPAVRHRDGADAATRARPARWTTSALLYLYPLADKDLLARIRNARLPQSYFECLLQALQSSFIYDRLIISWVNELPQPELAAEVVDFLIRFEEVDWAVCAGVYEDKLILSVRAAVEDARAGEMLRQVVGKLGRAGGHDRRAGGMHPAAEHVGQRHRGGAGRAAPPAAQGAAHRRVPRPAAGAAAARCCKICQCVTSGRRALDLH